jgi:uncharacterized membrane protein
MAELRKKRNPWLKRALFSGIILLLIGGGIYWYLSTEKFADTKDRKADYTVDAIEFIHEFQQNDSAANKKYSDKIITVNGIVSEIEAADTTVNIKFIDTASGSYAIFAFQEQHLAEAKAIRAGDSVSIKGSCSGGIHSDILGTESITFKRCTLNK